MRIDYPKVSKQLDDVDQLIDAALSANNEMKMQWAFEQVISSAAPGPAMGLHACSADRTWGGQANARLPEECQDYCCTATYGNGKSGWPGLDEARECEVFQASHFFDAHSMNEQHVEENLREFPDLYGDSLYGQSLCVHCTSVHDPEDRGACGQSSTCFECGGWVYPDEVCCTYDEYDEEY